jgi:oligopeptide/dipeptide ABC transporter ATP-binding protein
VVDYVADRIAVMYAGRIVEMAPKRELFEHPRHPYTETLLAAVLSPDPTLRSREPARTWNGQVEAPASQGCAFASRCRYVVERCRIETPELVTVGAEHVARCHRVGEIQLIPLPGSAHPTPWSGP